MANHLPTDVEQRLVAAWPTFDTETQAIFFAVLGNLLPENEPLLQELVEVTDHGAATDSDTEAQSVQPEQAAINTNLTLREQQIAAYALRSEYTPPPRGAWRQTVGI